MREGAGRCCSYRAVDRDGERIDSMLSEHRDEHAARRFLRKLVEVAGRKPLRATTDPAPDDGVSEQTAADRVSVAMLPGAR